MSQELATVLVLIHAQMVVIKMDVVSTSCTQPMHNVMDMDRANPLLESR